jgi:dolichol-phosphate mannosyltransferase
MKKLISIAIPCFNEENNIPEIYARIKNIIAPLTKYEFEILFIDNASKDNSELELRKLASIDKMVKVILNTRNFGIVRSPVWGLLQTRGEASILICCDMQEPPELISQLIQAWEDGWPTALLVREPSNRGSIFSRIKKYYYKFVKRISDVNLLNDATGNGIFDKSVIQKIRKLRDPNPYFRGIVPELGYAIKPIPYIEQNRKFGVSNNNWYVLYEAAMQGMTANSLVPIRFAGLIGFIISALSFTVGVFYIALKLIYWEKFSIGLAPLIISNLFLFGLLFLFIGIIGEYIASIQTYVKNRPLVVEKERINF